MTVGVIKSAPHFLIFILLLVFQISSAQRSSFDLNDEGWRVVGDVQGFTTIPEYDSTGGNPGGHCYAVDVGTGDYWYWVAPDTFWGDKSAAFGKYLRFDLKQNKTTGQSNKADVIMEGNGIKIFYDTPYNPDLVWTHYDVLLDTAGWERNSYNSGQSVTVDIFSSTGQKVFSEVLDFQSGTTIKKYSCRDWPAGVYWVRVSDAVVGVFRKIVVE